MATHNRFLSLFDLFILLFILGVVATFTLLIIRFDYFREINYYEIAIPGFVISGIGVAFGSFLFLYYTFDTNIRKAYNVLRSLQSLVLLVLSIGFGLSQYFLARKLQLDQDLFYWQTMLPLFIALGFVVLIIIMIALLNRWSVRYNELVKKKKKNTPRSKSKTK